VNVILSIVWFLLFAQPLFPLQEFLPELVEIRGIIFFTGVGCIKELVEVAEDD
jgi:hypothetical protein